MARGPPHRAGISVGVGVIVGVGVRVNVAVGVTEAVAVAVEGLKGVTGPQLIRDATSSSIENKETIRLKRCEGLRFAGIIDLPGSRITEGIPFIQWN